MNFVWYIFSKKVFFTCFDLLKSPERSMSKYVTKAQQGPPETSKMDGFVAMVNDF